MHAWLLLPHTLPTLPRIRGRTQHHGRQLQPILRLQPGSTHRHLPRLRAAGEDQLPGFVRGVMDELRADPVLRAVLDSPRMQRALQELKDDPAAAIQKYKSDQQVMSVIQRLTTLGFKDSRGLQALLHQLGTSPRDVAASVFADGDLAARLTQPRVRAAIAEIRANPEAGMAKYGGDADVMGVLDALHARLETQGTVIDV